MAANTVPLPDEFNVTGRVVLYETGEPLGDLVVHIWDVDPNEKGALIANLTTALQVAAGEKLDDVTLPSVERLGSVLTGPDGRFRLRIPSKLFITGDQEARPDLILLVLAPERVLAGNNPKRYSRVTLHGLLHFSVFPRINAGVEEAYSIQILQDVLDATGYLSRQKITRREQEVREREFQAALQSQRDKDRLSKRTAAESIPLKSLSGLQLWAERPQHYVSNIDSTLTQKVQEVLAAALESSSPGTTSRGMRLRLDPQEIESLRLTPESNLTSWARVEPMLARLGLGASSPLRIERHSLVDCADDARLRHALNPPPLEPPTPASDAIGSAMPTEATEFVRARIPAILGSGVSSNHLEGRRSLEDIRRDITLFSMPPAAGDSSSIFDFSHLQVAFPPIWTELFDNSLIAGARELHAELNERVETKAVSNPKSLSDFAGEVAAALGGGGGGLAMRPEVLNLVPELPKGVWASMDLRTQQYLNGLVVAYDYWAPMSTSPTDLDWLREIAAKLVTPFMNRSRLTKVYEELTTRLEEPYRFEIYAPGSINFGTLLTYRQRWRPLGYQVGELVKTLPLAPRESHKFSLREVRKQSFTERRSESSEQELHSERSETIRAEAEIVEKASNRTNFKLGAQASGGFLFFSASVNTNLEVDSARESSKTRKDFREAALKQTQRYKQSRSLQVDVASSFESEMTSSGEITNPNEEIPVTFMFFELQRKLEVSENLHRVEPVILVAQEVPAPDEITEAWLIRHAHRIRQTILDRSLESSLDFLTTSSAGDMLEIELLKESKDRHAGIVQDLKGQLAAQQNKLMLAQQGLDTALQSLAVMTGGGTEAGRDAERVRVDAAREAASRAQQITEDIRSQLGGEIAALQAAEEKYGTAVRERIDRQQAVLRLRLHVKENILHYMHAIWHHELPDQRFLRLFQISVPVFQPPDGEHVEVTSDANPILDFDAEPHAAAYRVRLPRMTAIPPQEQWRPLYELADLDRVVGFWGNYIAFPFRKSNYLAHLLVQDYVDEWLGALDPIDSANVTLNDLTDYAVCLRKHRPALLTPEAVARIEEAAKGLKRLASDNTDEVALPTGSLFIDALPGNHPLLEDFKLRHRAVDVQKALAERDRLELENLRYAARLLAGERGDPETERRVIVPAGTGVDVQDL
ncbi:MAG: hypothetical protein JNN08_21345 [Bryobacterales bacterium]|nr:hypothetical protein [Bryobacterales bacterium]